MLNYIWGCMIIISVLCASITGRIENLSGSIFSGADNAIKLIFSIIGMMALWTGLMKIAEKSGLTSLIAKFLSPITSRLFPEYGKNSNEIKAICMNITANLLGLGNAATPFGIAAMKELNKNNPHKNIATNSMVIFALLNTASIQLIPTMIASMRLNYGSKNPFDIIPAVWLTSFSALSIGILTAKFFEKRGKDIE